MGAIIYFAPRQPVGGSGWGIGHPNSPRLTWDRWEDRAPIFYLPWGASGPLVWLRQLLGHKRNNWQQTHPTIFSPSTSDNCFYQGPLLYFSEENQFQMYINGDGAVNIKLELLAKHLLLVHRWTFLNLDLLWFLPTLRAVVDPGLKNAFCFTWAAPMEVSSADWLFNQSVFSTSVICLFSCRIQKHVCNPCESHTAGMSLTELSRIFKLPRFNTLTI